MNRRGFVLTGAAAMFAPHAFTQEPFVTPRPPGAYGVGWVERPVSNVARSALIYYPAEVVSAAPQRAPSMDAAHVVNLTRRFGASVAGALAGGQGHAVPGVFADTSRFPLTIFAPGARLAPHDFRTLSEDIASRGYVVVAIAPGERADYAAVAADILAARDAALAWAGDGADRLGATIDVSRIAAFGHSLGGAAAALAAHRAEGIACVANLDGDFAGAAAAARPRAPLLYITSSDAHEPQSNRDRRAAVWRRVAAASAGAARLRAPTFAHFNFLDAALLASQIPAERRSGRFGTIEPTRGLGVAAALVGAFFDQTLKGRAQALRTALQEVPEVEPTR